MSDKLYKVSSPDGDEVYTIEQLREGYRVITGLNNDSKFSDDELYEYMKDVLRED